LTAIRIGVAGLGRIGWKHHCPEIARHPKYELAAVQDVDAERRREAEGEYGVRSFRSFSGMVRSADLEAVTIATPTHLHSRMTLAALRAGCHVLVEKPMAVNSRQAAEMVRLARRRKRVLTVFQSVRAGAPFQHLVDLLRQGIVGTVYHVRIGAYRYVRRDDWQSLRRYGGGALLNQGSHCLDELLQLVGYDVARVFCHRRLVAALGDAEDVAKVVVETRAGVVGELDINQASAVSPYSLQVYGTGGVVEMSPDGEAFTVTCVQTSDLPAKELNPSLASADRRYPHEDVTLLRQTIPVDGSYEVDMYAGFASAIRGGTPPFVKPEEPLAAMRLIDQCRRGSRRIWSTGAR
jgi:predicted dehydrogenase